MKRNAWPLWILLATGIAILAVGALPMQRTFFPTRRQVHERILRDMRRYVEAQQAYRKTDWDGDGKLVYADTLDKLADAGLIDRRFAKARGPQGTSLHGYLFLEVESIAGEPVDWTVDFGLCAIPAVYGKTGYLSYLVCTNETVLPCDQGPGSSFRKDYPGDPTVDWWWCEEGADW